MASVVHNVVGIVFLGTPHDAAIHPKILDDILKVTFHQENYVRDLRSESAIVSQINFVFKSHAKSLKLMCYYESHGYFSHSGVTELRIPRSDHYLGHRSRILSDVDTRQCQPQSLAWKSFRNREIYFRQ